MLLQLYGEYYKYNQQIDKHYNSTSIQLAFILCCFRTLFWGYILYMLVTLNMNDVQCGNEVMKNVLFSCFSLNNNGAESCKKYAYMQGNQVTKHKVEDSITSFCPLTC